MTVSVLVPAYNHERFVVEALESVAAQTYGDLEVVIVDDASTDGTARVIRAWLERTGFPARFVANQQNRGVCAVLNQALSLTTGEFVCGLATDDRMAPDRVERHVRALAAAGPEVAAVVSDMRVIDAAGAELHPSYLGFIGHGPWRYGGRIFERLLAGNIIPAPAVMMRRSALEAVGPWDESLVFEDYDMWLRLADRFEFAFVEGAVVDYRMLSTSSSHHPVRLAALCAGELRCLLKWVGRSPVTDRVIAERLYGLAHRAQPYDPAVARQAVAAANGLGLGALINA